MNANARSVDALARVLRDAGETHQLVYKKVNGEDADWASWYANWLINLSPLPEILGHTPVRSELVYWLVALDRAFRKHHPDVSWERFHAEGLLHAFAPTEAAQHASAS